MVRGDDYKFLPIVDAILAINQRVNLTGVVTGSSIPKKSKGTDYFCTLKVVDESRVNPGITVNVFAENMEKLPQLECNGDIIQLVSVVMKRHNSEVYASYDKKCSSFALYEGKHGTSFDPYQVSSKYYGRDQDKKFIADLRRWLIDNEMDLGGDDSLSLKEITDNECFNLMCKVLHISELTEERILFVWDGTDTPVTTLAKLEDKIGDPLHLHLESSPLPLDVLRTFPTVGTVLRVFIDCANEKLSLHVLKTGKWVKIMKMRCDIREAMWRGVLMPFTKLRYLDGDNELVLMRERFYDERIKSKFGRVPETSFPWPSHVTETDYPDVAFCTLTDMLAYPEVTAIFKCVVRVVEVYPCRAEDFFSPLGICRIRLTLEDPTARVYAFVYAEDGIHFFGTAQSIKELTRKRNMLLGISACDGNELKNVRRNPSWIQCCIKSYYLDEDNIWGSRRYRIFGTRLVNEL